MLDKKWHNAVSSTGDMVQILRITLLALCILVQACSFRAGKQHFSETDFIEPVPPERSEDIQLDIKNLKKHISADPDNAALHRRLSIYYRFLGTPRSRLLSIEQIDKAIELEPDNPINHVERGLTMLARSFIGEAETCLRDAIKIDSECFHAWYHLGRIKKDDYLRTMCFPDDLKAALRYFRKAHLLKPKHKDTLFNLAFLHMFRSMFRTARMYAAKALEEYPDDPKLHRLMGTMLLQQGKLEEAQEEFAIALKLMHEEDRTEYEDIAALLGREERELYETYPDAEKLGSIKKFWIENDPTPTTELNERWLEHIKRVFLAQELLTNERLGLKGTDTHRGRAVISYGLPHKKYYNLGAQTDGPMVVWHYKYGPDSFNLYFQDEFLNGNFHFPIENRYYGELSVIAMERFPQSYDFPIKCDEFTASTGFGQVRGSKGKTTIGIAVAIPDSLLSRRRDRWDVTWTLFDFDLRRVQEGKRTFRPDTLPYIEKSGYSCGIYTFDIEAPPITLESSLAIELIQENWKQRAVIKHPIMIRDFSRNSLAMSTVNLTLLSADGSCSTILDPFALYNRDEMLCLTYEIYNLSIVEGRARYRLTYMIKKTEEEKPGIMEALAYIMASVRGKSPDEAPYIVNSIEQSTNDNTVHDTLQIDIGALEPQRYVLAVTVEDLNSGKIVSEERAFSVTD